jgi:hypothetical protein
MGTLVVLPGDLGDVSRVDAALGLQGPSAGDAKGGPLAFDATGMLELAWRT